MRGRGHSAIGGAFVAAVLMLAPATTTRAQTPRLAAESGAGRPELGGGRVLWGGHARRILHFTFDDGPSVGTTGALLDALDAHRMRATFFVTARHVDPRRWDGAAGAELVRRMVRRGHTVGAHTQTHVDLTQLGRRAILGELREAEALLTPLIGARPVLFRPPFGRHDARVDAIVQARGYTVVTWNVAVERSQRDASRNIVRRMRAELDARERSRSPGGVVLLHDTRAESVRAFTRIVSELEARNCALLERGEDLWELAPDLSPFFQARRRWEVDTEHADVGALDDAAWRARQQVLRATATERCQ